MSAIHEKLNLANTEHRIKTFIPADWVKLAEWIARFDPGPAYKFSLTITGDSSDLTSEEILLLRRSFSKFTGIHLDRIGEGQSKAKVLMVCPHRGGRGLRRRSPYLVKLGPPDLIISEQDKYRAFVHDLIPFDHRPNLHRQLSAYGNATAVMVGDFVDHATTLSAIWGAYRAEGIVSSAVIYGALGDWRFDARKKPLNLGDQFRMLRVLRQPHEYADKGAVQTDSYKRSRVHGASLSPAKVLSRLTMLRPIETRECIVHGDLHADNIMVRIAPLNIFIIDFSNAHVGPAVTDPAILEVSLTFRFNPTFDPKFLSTLYQYPITVLPETLHEHGKDRVFEAVQAIRRSGCWNEVNGDAYTFAIIAHLFQYASYSSKNDPDGDRRALAYYLAQKLTVDLVAALKRKVR